MTTNPAPPVVDTQQRYKGSLTGTLVRTLLIFTFIPLVLMAGAAYFRTRALLRDQAIAQTENLLSNQLKVVNEEVLDKQEQFETYLDSSGDFSTIVELALHANPQSREFQEIRKSFLSEIEKGNNQGNRPLFDYFFLLDKDGVIKVSSNADWQATVLNSYAFEDLSGSRSYLLYGLSPIYENELILVTAVTYQTQRGSTLGTLVGITEKENLQQLIQPLNGLAPFASTYFILSDNRFIASDPATGNFKEATVSTMQDDLIANLSKLIKDGNNKPTALDVISPEGESSLAQLQWLPDIQSGIVLEIDNKNIYGEITSLAPFTIILVIVTLAGVGLALTFGIRRVIKPLQSLSEITRKFAEGDWNQRAEVLSNDEVGLLASSFNYMANEIGEVYYSLEQKVEERTRQIQTASEVAQNITTSSSLDDMLQKTTDLLVQQFGYQQASIYMLDRSGKFIDFKIGSGAATTGLREKNYRIEMDSPSIIGWVASNNQSRIASDVSEDPLHLRNELISDTRSEASVPIALGNLVLGVLDVQSTQTGIFSEDTIIMLQTLANQIATATQTASLIETSQMDFEELERLYRSSRLITEANNEEEIFNISGQILEGIQYPTALIRVEQNRLYLIFSNTEAKGINTTDQVSSKFDIDYNEISNSLFRGFIIAKSSDTAVPQIFHHLIKKMELINAAFLPIKRQGGKLVAVILIGSRNISLTNAIIQPYSNLADLISSAIEKTDAIQQTEKHLREVESLASINDLISYASDLQNFFRALL